MSDDWKYKALDYSIGLGKACAADLEAAQKRIAELEAQLAERNRTIKAMENAPVYHQACPNCGYECLP